MKKLKVILACLLAGHTIASPAQSELLQAMVGNWQFTASNNGVEVAPGIYSAGTDQFAFTAAISDDGQSLDCHADCLYRSRQGNEYPADWRLLVEEDGEGKHRIGWVLTKEKAAFTKEFEEPKESYLENGFFYWGTGAEEHHYIFLLAENADATDYVAPVFWSEWSSADTKEYSLMSTEYNSQKLYARVAANEPYANSIGCIEIWASVKLQRGITAGIDNVNAGQNAADVKIINLQGIRTSGLQKGFNIVNGRKVVVR